jgi:Putative death-receptor fusion protein (DUF2428)
MLNLVMDRLTDIISKPVVAADELDQSRDIIQVHAINILRAVVQESNLASAVSRYYTSLTIVAIDGFMSPLWTIRNASLQLLGLYNDSSVKHTLFCVA